MAESVEFLVAKATDPYSDDGNQKEFLKRLCASVVDKLNETVAIKLLTHKMLSPDQNEAFNALNAFDFLSINSDVSIFEAFNRLSTLNAFIQLLSPEQQGGQTVPKNKDKAISLLSAWKDSKANVENISKVYSMLCSRKIIDSKPPLDPSAHNTSSSKAIEFNRQTSNTDSRISKGRAESSVEAVEMVRLKAQILNDLLDTIDAANQTKDETLLHEIYDQLINVRPMLFHFAVEASEKQEHEMVEILALNDQLSCLITRHKLNGIGKPPHPINEHHNVSVRFDPESTKTDRISNVQRKPTPHSKAAGLLNDNDYSKFLASASKLPNSKRLSDSSINEEVENLEISESNSPVPE